MARAFSEADLPVRWIRADGEHKKAAVGLTAAHARVSRALSECGQEIADARAIPPDGRIDAIALSDAQILEVHRGPGREGGPDGLKRPQDKGHVGKRGVELAVQVAERVEGDLVGQQAEKITEPGAVPAVEVEGGEGRFATRIGLIGDGCRGGREHFGISRQPACGGGRTFLAGVKWGGAGSAGRCDPGSGKAPLSVSLGCVVLVISTWARSFADEEKNLVGRKKIRDQAYARAAACERRGPGLTPDGGLPPPSDRHLAAPL